MAGTHRHQTPKVNEHRRIPMNTTTTRFARYFALPVVSAGIIGGAALGLAGAASATTSTEPTGPGYSYGPTVTAPPAPEAQPGWRWHHGVHHLETLQPGYSS
jgi:hypothetical protein